MTEQLAGKLSSSVTQFNQSADRLFPLDLLKAISITAVVSYHSIFVPRSTYADSLLTLDILFAPLRFCVPVLFTISFLLFERGLANHSNKPVWLLIKKRLIRLGIPTVFWFSLAAGLKLLKGNTVSELISTMLNGSIFLGAYYLLVMLQFVPVFVWLRCWFNNLKHVLITVLLQGFVFLLIHAALSGTAETQVLHFLRTLGRPLFVYWFVYMALGAYFWKNWFLIVQISNRIPMQLKLVTLCLTCLILAVEYRWLFLVSGKQITPFDYAMLSCILSVLVAVLCFASVEKKQLSWRIKKTVLVLSKYSLGIFCINGLLSEVFLSFGNFLFSTATFSLAEIIVIKFVGWGVLVTFSLGLSVLLDRAGLRKCVS